MNEKEDFINQLLQLVKQPLVPGENPPVITDELIQDLNESVDLDDALAKAELYGLGEYVNQWAISQDIQPTANLDLAIQQAILGQDPDQYIGVSPDQVIMYGGQKTTVGNIGENFYQYGDQNVFVNLTPEEIRDIQADLINAGLLGASVGRPFRPGVWDIKYEGEAMKLLMGQANAQGVGKAEKGWQNMMQLFLDNPIATPQEIQTNIYPDYSAISNSINGMFERELNRKPNEYEKKLLANQYLGDVEKQYQSSVPKDDQPITPDTLENYGNHINIEDVESREDVDPNARLFETFDSITQKEQERLGRNVDIQATNKLIIDSITSIPT